MFNQHSLPVWLCTSSVSTPASEPLNPLCQPERLTVEWTWSNFTGKAQSYFCDGPLTLFCSYTSSSIFAGFFWSLLLFLLLFFWHMTPPPWDVTSQKQLKGQSWGLVQVIFSCFSGDILEEKCRWRSVRACLLLRMAGCTSRCRQGVLKLIQSLQRLVSGTLTKGTLSLKCTLHDCFMGSFPLGFIFRSISEPITVGLLAYLKHLNNFFCKEFIYIPLLMLDARVFLLPCGPVQR